MSGHYVIPVDKLERFVQDLVFSGMPKNSLTPELPGPIRDALRKMSVAEPKQMTFDVIADGLRTLPDPPGRPMTDWDAVDLSGWDCPNGAPCAHACELGECIVAKAEDERSMRTFDAGQRS